MLSALLLVFIAGVFWGVVVELVIRLLVFGILGIIFLGLAYWLHKKDMEREKKRGDILTEIIKSIDVLANEIRQDINERNSKQS